MAGTVVRNSNSAFISPSRFTGLYEAFWLLIHRGIKFAQGRPQPASPLGIGPDGLARSFVDPPRLPSPAAGGGRTAGCRFGLHHHRSRPRGVRRTPAGRPGWGPSRVTDRRRTMSAATAAFLGCRRRAALAYGFHRRSGRDMAFVGKKRGHEMNA